MRAGEYKIPSPIGQMLRLFFSFNDIGARGAPHSNCSLNSANALLS